MHCPASFWTLTTLAGGRNQSARSMSAKLLVLAIFSLVSLCDVHAQTETILYRFPANGASPQAGLISDGQGNVFGTTSGAFPFLFKIDESGNFSVLQSIDSIGEISTVISTLTLDGQGNLYGDLSGSTPLFQTFQFTPTGAYKILSPTGVIFGDPPAGVVLDAQNNVYGPNCPTGSTVRCSIVKITPAGNVSTLHTFPAGDILLGLSQDPNGNLYASFSRAGNKNVLTIYKTTVSGQTKLLHKFVGPLLQFASFLTVDAKGNIYGETLNPFTNDHGSIFELTPTGTLTTLFTFNGTDGSLAGSCSTFTSSSQQSLVLDSAGNLYGATSCGGSHGNGTVFKLSPSGALTTLYSFGESSDDGATPNGVIRDQSGNLLGTTVSGGGSNNNGTVFKITIP